MAAVLWGALLLYRGRIATISLSERRFLTTEWRLLQVLKARTDQQLFEKDQQIADLNRLYLELIQSNAPLSRRQQVKDQIDQAEVERAAILSRSISAAAAVSPAAGAAPDGQVSSGNEPALVALLQSQIERLQTQLDSRSALVDTLNREREALIATNQQVVQGYADTIKGNEARIEELVATIARMRDELAGALAAADRQAREAGAAQPLDIQDLRTKTLVRALVDSPEIRAAYPGLLESLDHFLDVYGREQRLAGQREAYAAMESIYGPLAEDAPAP